MSRTDSRRKIDGAEAGLASASRPPVRFYMDEDRDPDHPDCMKLFLRYQGTFHEVCVLCDVTDLTDTDTRDHIVALIASDARTLWTGEGGSH